MGLGIFSSSSNGDDKKDAAENGRQEGRRAVTGPWFDWDGDPSWGVSFDSSTPKREARAYKRAYDKAKKAEQKKGWWS